MFERVLLLNLPASINRRSAAGRLSKHLVRHFAERGTRVLTRCGQRFWPGKEAIELALVWRTQLTEALSSAEFGRGLVINFLPFLSPEGSRKLKVWAWVAASTHTRAALKMRIKEVMPKVAITKV